MAQGDFTFSNIGLNVSFEVDVPDSVNSAGFGIHNGKPLWDTVGNKQGTPAMFLCDADATDTIQK